MKLLVLMCALLLAGCTVDLNTVSFGGCRGHVTYATNDQGERVRKICSTGDAWRCVDLGTNEVLYESADYADCRAHCVLTKGAR